MATEQPGTPKKQAKPRERHFEIEDSLLLQRSRTIRQHFVNHIAAFTAFDNDLDPIFALEWQTAIDAADAHPTDAAMDTELAAATAQMESTRNACFARAADMEFFVKKAFPKKQSVLKEFGLTERKKLRAQSANTVIWMLAMRVVADNFYPSELAAVNMPATLPADLQAAGEALAEKEVTQEVSKRMNLRQTRLRIEKLNHLHSFTTTVHRAAQSVFANDAEKRALFNLT